MLGAWLVFLDLKCSSACVLKLLWPDRAEEDRLACVEDVGFLFTAPLAALERRDIVRMCAKYSCFRDGGIWDPVLREINMLVAKVGGAGCGSEG